MTLNGVIIADILRYSAELGSSGGQLREHIVKDRQIHAVCDKNLVQSIYDLYRYSQRFSENTFVRERERGMSKAII